MMDATHLRSTFEKRGFVAVAPAMPAELVAAVAGDLLKAEAAHERPVVKLGDRTEAPFRAFANQPVLHAAFDALLGPGAWAPPAGLEDVRVRYRSEPRLAFWHVDVFERGPETVESDARTWRASLGSGGVAIVAFVLLSDSDPPIVLREGSHHVVAGRLPPDGASLSLGELLAGGIAAATASLPQTPMCGPAGTVFLCHPHLVHSAPAHRSEHPAVSAVTPIRLKPSASRR